MFTDKAKILIKAGNGGNGAIAFHREKYVAAGGPDGGDGGNGGNVIFHVDPGLCTLMDFRYKRKYTAQNGGDGFGKRCNGKKGEDIIINVPQGTIVRDAATNRILADMSDPEKDVILAKGGSGGWGNSHFATATRQTPNFAKNGTKGMEREVILELKLLADVGLVGFPNVGKSTILSRTTKADPKIANYHFTTLEPNLGVVELDGGMSFVLADIPGIIEGASGGKGLGLAFLKHIERTSFLLFVLDSERKMSLKEQFCILQDELKKFSPLLSQRAFGIVLSKSDTQNFGDEFKQKFQTQKANLAEFLSQIQNPQKFILEISSLEKSGLNELKFALQKELKK